MGLKRLKNLAVFTFPTQKKRSRVNAQFTAFLSKKKGGTPLYYSPMVAWSFMIYDGFSACILYVN